MALHSLMLPARCLFWLGACCSMLIVRERPDIFFKLKIYRMNMIVNASLLNASLLEEN